MWTDKKDAVDVLRESKLCLMDVTSAWLFGVGQGTSFLTDSGEADDFFEMFENNNLGHFWRSEFFRVTNILQWFGIDLVPQKSHQAAIDLRSWSTRLCGRALNCIEEGSRDEASPAYPFACAHMRNQLEASKFPPDKLDACIATELLDHMIASHDAGGIAVTYALYQLSLHPKQQEALRSELHQHFPNAMTSPVDLEPLPLLDVLVLETLRLYSPNPGPWPRQVKHNASVGGFQNIPMNTILSVKLYSTPQCKRIP